MKTLTSTIITLLLFTNIVYSQHRHTHNPSEVKIERELFSLVKSINIDQKILTEDKVILKNDYEMKRFTRFVESKFNGFFKQVFHQLLDNKINIDQAKEQYLTKTNNLIKQIDFATDFKEYLNSIELAKQNKNNSIRGGTSRTKDQPCTNLDFEEGTWNTWEVFEGKGCNAYIGCYTNMLPGTASNGGTPQHLITGAGMDPNVPVSTLSPSGGGSSLRLGNLGASNFAEQIKNEFLVTSDKPYFSFEFAVVIQDPRDHDPEEMPFFMIEFFDSSGINIITDSCGNYYVDPTTPQALSTFDYSTPGWAYKDWARVTVDLTPYIGQNVTIQFTTSDCTQGGHEGRAYIDAECSNAEIEILQDCEGIRLQAPLGYSKYIWSTGDPADTLDHLYIPGPGYYSVELVSETGCSITVDTLANEVYIKLNHQVDSTNPICFGDANGTITITPFGGTLPYQYSIDNGTTWQASNIFNGLSSGSYTVITQGSQGCERSTLINLTEPPLINPNIVNSDAICFGDCNGSASVIPTGGSSPNGNYRVEWNGSSNNSFLVGNLCPGTHNVKIIDEKGCFIVQAFSINEPPATTINQVIVDDEICYNNCDGKITINDPNAIEYSIDGGNTFQSSNSFSNLCAQAGPYNVTIKDGNGCIAKQIAPLNQPPPLIINLNPDTNICLNKPAILFADVIGGTDPINYQWSNGKNGAVIEEVPEDKYTIYSVVATDANGCWVAGQTEVYLFPQPIADFDYSPSPETDIFNTLIEFNDASTTVSNLKYEWYFDILGTSSLKDDEFEFPAEGGKNYSICLKIEDENKCRDSICKPLFVNYETLVYVPNSFTPDEDGINDIFFPSTEGLDESKYKFYVFNRWGDLIFETEDKSKGWNGKHRGNVVKQDSYVWRIVSVRKADNSIFEKIGHVNLLR